MIESQIIKRLKKAFKGQNDSVVSNETSKNKNGSIEKIGEYYMFVGNDNILMARAQFGISQPYDEQQKSGIMALYLQKSQIMNPQLEVWKPRPTDKIQGRIISRGLRETLNLDKLYFGPGCVGSIDIDIEVYSRGSNMLNAGYQIALHAVKEMFKAMDPEGYRDSITPELYPVFQDKIRKYSATPSVMVTTYYVAGNIAVDIPYREMSRATDAISWIFDSHGLIRTAVMHGEITGIDRKDFEAMCKLAQSTAKSKIKSQIE